jgi:hypothetical protein
MARQEISNGAVANDESGDTLREGARKINENFIELYRQQLPSQSGNAGRYLQTNGTQAVWAPLNVVNITGNAGTVTNGVVTTGSYDDPSWITELDGGKLTGTVVATDGVVTTGSYANPGWITSLSFNKITGTVVATDGVVTTGSYVNPSWIVSLSGDKLTGTVVATNGVVTTALYLDPDWIVTLDGGKITNAVLTTGSYNDPLWINSIAGSKVSGNISGNAGTVTNGVVTTGSYNDPSWITGLSATKVLPDQSGNNGKFLFTDGSAISWSTVTLPPSYDQSLNTTDSVEFDGITASDITVNGTVTAEEFITDSPGTPEIYSDTDLNLSAVNAVIITDSVLRLNQFTALEIADLTGVNGDIIYNSDTHKFQGYANGSWVDLH